MTLSTTMRSEKEVEKMLSRVVSELEDCDGGTPNDDDYIKWQKLEAAMVALEYALGQDDTFEIVMDNY